MSDQSSDMGSKEISHRGHRSKYRQRRGPWEIYCVSLKEESKDSWMVTHRWKSYSDEEIARKNCDKLNRELGCYTSKRYRFEVRYNKDKEKNGS